MENENIPSQYKPISPFGYWGYNILFSIPIIGLIFLIVYAFDSSNINRRNYARSFFVGIFIVIILIAAFAITGLSVFTIFNTMQ